MKRTVLLLCLGVALLSSAQNIPNRQFENWETIQIFELPEYWVSSNVREGSFNVNKTDDAHSGTLAIHLKNDTDSSFGYFMMGHVGENGPDGGFAYAARFDSVTGWYKSNLMEGDTALVITMKFGPSDTSIVMSPLYGNANTWMRFAFEVPSHPQTHVFFGVVSTNPFIPGNYFPESEIIIDDVAFSYSSGSEPDTLTNATFERWYPVFNTEPLGWNTLNFMSTAHGLDPSVVETSDAYQGESAVKVSTVAVPERGKVGWLFNGLPPGPNGFLGGFPYNDIPTSLSGYYKYLPNGADTAIIAVIGYYHDEMADSTTLVFFRHRILTAVSQYTPFHLQLDYDTTQAINQINIIAGSSMRLFDRPDDAMVGTALFLDDLWLESKCAFADTTDLFAFRDTVIRYNRTETPLFVMDSTYRSYLWSTGDTSYWIEITSDPFEVTIMVTDSNGCILTDSLTFTLDFRASVEVLNNPLLFYPNPCTTQITVTSKGNAELLIFDMHGKRIRTVPLLSGTNHIATDMLPAGQYVITMIENDSLRYGILIKE